MKNKIVMFVMSVLIAVVGSCVSSLAQRGNNGPKTLSKIEYHGGPVMRVSPDVYVIWYGGWPSTFPASETQIILAEFLSHIGGSAYFHTNTAYSDSEGYSPTGSVFYGGAAADTAYSHGWRLTESDIEGIVGDRVAAGQLPLDTAGIYMVVGSSDVAAPDLGFCTQPYAPPAHGRIQYNGTPVRFAFIGDPSVCPSLEAPQFVAPNGDVLPTPNANLAVDAMTTKAAQALSDLVTDPNDNAWYDRYGFEAGDKCWGLFGTTYTAANGARANVKLGQRDYLLQQNWTNDRRGRGYCTLSYP